MAIFETLSILFKADSTQLKKEVDDVKKKTKEYTGVSKESEEQTKKTDNEFVELSKTLAKVAATYFGASTVIGAFKSSLGQTKELSQLSKETNVSIETLDKFGRAVKNAGGNADSFHNSVLALAKITNAAPETVYDQIARPGGLADQFRKAHLQNPAKAQIFGEDYGFAPGDIAFLTQGGASIRAALARQEELGVTTPEDAELSDAFTRSSGELDDALDSLKRAILQDALPEFVKLTDAVTKIVLLFTRNKETPEESLSFLEALDEALLPESQDFLRENSFFYQKYFGNRKPKTSSVPDEGQAANEAQVELPPISGTSEVPVGFSEIPYLPPKISQISNSQARNLHVGNINVHSNSSDPTAVANQVVGKLDQESQFMQNQFQQSNANFDNAVVA